MRDPYYLLTEVSLLVFGHAMKLSSHSLNALAAFLLGLFALPAHADILYGSNPNTATIDKVTSTGVGSVFASTGFLTSPAGVAFDSAGNLYVADAVNNTILKFTPGGVKSTFASTGLNGPRGLAFDSAGNLFAANYGDATIEKFNIAGVGSLFASGLSAPRGLAFNSTGNLYVADGLVIQKYTSGGVGSVFANTGGLAPDGLAFDSSGNLYVAYSAGSVIEKFTSAGVGSDFATFASSGISGPDAIAFDSTGNLYVANGSGQVIKITPGGVGSVFTNSYLIQSDGLAFTNNAGVPLPLANQVPEPATALLVCLGLPSLLFLRRSSKQVF